jgi:hypothetical protein
VGLKSAIMADLASIAAALTSVRTIIDLVKNAKDAQLAMTISSELGNIQGKLIDVQQQTLTIQQENQQLRGELQKLRSSNHHHSVMWRQRDDGTEDGPFCPICVSEAREMRLTIAPGSSRDKDYWLLYCPRGHGQPGTPNRSLLPVPGPSYRVPKNLFPENYFYVPAPEAG